MFAIRNASRSRTPLLVAVIGVLLLGGLGATAVARQADDEDDDEFTQSFNLDQCHWDTTGGNLFFSLQPGFRTVHEGEEDGEPSRLETTVLGQTRRVDGVRTRVIEERQFISGELAEVSRNFYSLCRQNGSVFYFGEEVDFYENGQITGHEGAWLAGVDGAQAGLYMPGLPLLGARYYQEIADDVALDRAEIVSLDEQIQTPAGTFDGCMRTIETTPLEPGAEESKIYCPEVGITDDGGLLLVSVSPGHR
jgi:hypothetical protein